MFFCIIAGGCVTTKAVPKEIVALNDSPGIKCLFLDLWLDCLNHYANTSIGNCFDTTKLNRSFIA